MEMLRPTMTDHENMIRIYSGSDIDPPHYWVWFEGEERFIVRNHGEHALDLWKRVLKEVTDMRLAVRNQYSRGREYSLAHVYAGVQPSELERRERARELCIARLWQHADPRFNDDHEARVEALCVLADIFGGDAPRKVRVEATLR
ncbi:hypothetical protein [Burkholderia stagnalis]|uniref:hypothetical protein n=1 Tax=Burkholderia stagnalis TaxID=1503054 RepID=UPI000AE76802|nr:hypothetical protein [Burkholderia stagnalis]